MKYFIYLTFILSILSCVSKTELAGVWNLELNIQENKIPFYLVFSEKKVTLQNNSELIELEYSLDKENILIPILNYDAALELKQLGNTLRGHWIKYNRTPAYKLAVFGMKTTRDTLPDIQKSYFDKSVNMKLSFDGKPKGILTHSKGNNHSSIVTETGDYRYLTSKKIKDEVVFYGFDGFFAFYLRGKMQGGSYNGKFYAGPSYSKEFEGVIDPDFKLRDPNKITTYNGKLNEITLPGLDGKDYDLKGTNKITVFQIFGSWCPNCIDETKFILNWRKKNPNKAVDFKIVSFERSPSKKHALKMLKKTKRLHGIDYPILIGGYTKEDKVSKIFPGIKDFISFPTTIYVDSQNKVRKIHAGFNGPATGEFFETFTKEFDEFINKVLAE